MKRKSSKNSNLKNNEELNNNQQELQQELDTLNLALVALFIVLYGIVLNINFVLVERIKVLDGINNTNYAEQLADLSDTPRKTNVLFLFSTCIYTYILWNAYVVSAADNSESRDEDLIRDNYNKFVAILLILLATTINFEVLNT